MDSQALQKALTVRQRVLGVGIDLVAPQLVEVVGVLGADFVILDMEHTSATLETIDDLILAARHVDVAPLVRLPSRDPGTIQRILDIGAAGIVIPHIDTRADLDVVLKATEYKPTGRRGMCSLTRSAMYTTRSARQDYLDRNEEIIRIALIETPEAVENVNDLFDAGSLDAAILGPGDISNAIGHHGDFQHEEVVSLLERVIEVGEAQDVAIGAYATSRSDAQSWLDRGADFLFYSDVRLIRAAMTDHVLPMQEGRTE
jgi:4-hydroxy-2-oxoheptanedioate aldolase